MPCGVHGLRGALAPCVIFLKAECTQYHIPAHCDVHVGQTDLCATRGASSFKTPLCVGGKQAYMKTERESAGS